MIAGPPESNILISNSAMHYTAGRPVDVVWLNELGGLTLRIEDADKSIFLKWAPKDSGLDLNAERIRMTWALSFIAVPKVIDFGEDGEGSWLVTEGLDAENAASDKWKQNPEVAVTAIGRGLRAMHDTLPVDVCPFIWSMEDRIARARARVIRGETHPAKWHEEFGHLSSKEVLTQLDTPPSVDQLVVCHGDACAPNTLINESGDWVGHVDLGGMGIADRWADIAIAAWSTQWNYGTGWENLLYDSYGIAPEPEKIRFYRLLWDLDE